MPASCGAQTEALETDEMPAAFAQRSLHILHLLMLDFAPARIDSLRRGQAEWDLASAYANTFSTSHVVNDYHDGIAYRGHPLALAEVIGLHQTHLLDALLFVDGEIIRTALGVRLGLSPSVSVSLEVPYLYRDVTLDSAIRSFHRHIGQDQNGRDLFPSGELALLVQGASEPFAYFQRSPHSGVGDITGALGWRPRVSRVGLVFGGDLTVKAPTGNASELNGSGGWDAGVLAFALWRRAGWTLEADGSLVVPGAWKGPLRIDTDPFGRILASVIRDLGRRTRIGASITVEQSPFRQVSVYSLSRTGVELGLGLEQDIATDLPVRLTLTKGLPALGDRADFGIGLALRYRISASPYR